MCAVHIELILSNVFEVNTNTSKKQTVSTLRQSCCSTCEIISEIKWPLYQIKCRGFLRIESVRIYDDNDLCDEVRQRSPIKPIFKRK